MKPIRSRLMSLEVGRGVAALLVCLYHYIGFNEKYFGDTGYTLLFSGGNVGVDYFFVLSGFIIYWVHRADIGIEGRVSVFLKKRFIRIFPIFWAIVAPVGVMMLLVPSLGAEKDLTLNRFLIDLMLIPREGELVLPPAWTLQRELFFYALFSIYVFRPREGFYLLVTWQLLCLMNTLAPFTPDDHTALTNVALGQRNLGFGFGLLSAYVVNRFSFDSKLSISVTTLGLGAFFILLVSEGYYMLAYGQKTSSLDISYVWNQGYIVSAFLIVVGLVSYELKKPLHIHKSVAVFGSASYVLYLVHLPAGSIIYKIMNSHYFRGMINPEVAFWLAVMFAVLVAISIHLFIEKSLMRYFRMILLGQTPKPANVAA